jgi:hypothetical protein
MNHILSKIRSSKTVSEIANYLAVFSEEATAAGVSVISRLLDVLA